MLTTEEVALYCAELNQSGNAHFIRVESLKISSLSALNKHKKERIKCCIIIFTSVLSLFVLDKLANFLTAMLAHWLSAAAYKLPCFHQ